MASEQEQLQAGIAALEAQRALLGDAVADAALVPLRSKLAALAAAQPAAAVATQTLKQVTILFLDIVGSTALSQHLDPEEVHAVIDGALARCTQVVDAHRGKVLQYAGDNLLAAFGTDEAREDDAERAVRCGLALLAEGRTVGAEVLREHAHAGFDVRVGVHTGGVLLGGGVDAEGSIRGIAVNIAARMEQTAPAGALRISRDTLQHVRGMFEVRPQAPIAVKGIDAPIANCLVERSKPRSFRNASRGIEGVETRMLGRDAELEALQHAFERLHEQRRFGVVTVVAEAGIGKSRLLQEFENWTATRPEAFHPFLGRAHPHTQGQPYGLLRDVVASWLQIADDDTLAAAQAKVERGIVPLFLHDDGEDLAEGHAHLLGHLIGLDFGSSRHILGIRDDAEQIRNRAFHAAAQMFRRVSAIDHASVLLQLEDLHWADDASLDFLGYLAQVNVDVPMLIVGLARPALFERRAEWGGGEGIHRRIDLNSLDAAASELLAGDLLKRFAVVPAALSELIIRRGEGNPFFMEELVKMLADQGAIETGSDSWTLDPGKLSDTPVPQTLSGVLQARLDALPAPEKQALQQASVIGLVFWDQALAALDARAPAALPALLRRDLAVPRPEASLEGALEYAFRHQILHQVTYDTVLKPTRRALHGQVAKWLAGLSGARASDFLGATAEHFEKAGEDAEAAEYHARAAEHARTRFAHAAALHHVQSALSLLDKAAPGDATEANSRLELRWRLLAVREHTLDLQGRREAQRADIAALGQIADALDDDQLRTDAALRRSAIATRSGDYRAQESAARQAIALAERTGDRAQRLRGQKQLATALAVLGELEQGHALARQGLAEARASGLRSIEGLFLNSLTIIAKLREDVMGGLELTTQSLSINRELGNRRAEAIALGNLGHAWLNLGELRQARHYAEEALRLHRANGDRVMESSSARALAALALCEGDPLQAQAQARLALDIATVAQARDMEAAALYNVAHAELALGHHAAAAEDFEQVLVLARAMNYPMLHDAAAGLARVALARGDGATALQHVEGLLPHLASGSAPKAQPRLIELVCYEVLAHAHDPRAAGVLERAYAELMATAATIGDEELRRGFLHHIPEHRAIVAAWAAAKGAGCAG